jgi:hypothetical protein
VSMPPASDYMPEIAIVSVLPPAKRARAQTDVPQLRRVMTRSMASANCPVSARTRSQIIWSR